VGILNKDSLELARELILKLSEHPGVSGYEYDLAPFLQEVFGELSTETDRDFMGNIYARQKGCSSRQEVMLTAHADEIGLIVNYIDASGFIRFTAVGGIDQRTLLNQEVIIHGLQDIPGVISLIPARERNCVPKRSFLMEDLFIDVGLTREKAVEQIRPGDIVSIKRRPQILLNQRIAGKALDDRAGLVALTVCLNELKKLRHHHPVTVVATVQEEVGLRGATTGADSLKPEIAVAVDVTHAQSLDTKTVNIQLGKGPVLTLGPNIHPRIFEGLQAAAKENRIPCQIQAAAGPTGTDANVLQLSGFGVPTGLVSIPLRYMHTSVETLALTDVVDCGKLLACYIAALPENLEELSCF